MIFIMNLLLNLLLTKMNFTKAIHSISNFVTVVGSMD